VVIGKDTRISGLHVRSGAGGRPGRRRCRRAAAGADADPGGGLTRTLGADAGIVISASHNPHYDNGIKFFSAQGEKLDDATELARSGAGRSVHHRRIGKARRSRAREAVGRYIEFCKASVPRAFDLRGVRLVLDCAHGATYQIARCCSANWAPR
jgi:phosphoglucosamine mutase